MVQDYHLDDYGLQIILVAPHNNARISISLQLTSAVL